MNYFKTYCRRLALLLWLVGWQLLPGIDNALAQTTSAEEYAVKAAFLYNFAKFVNWPENDFASLDAPLVIGVYGGNPFADDFDRMFVGKKIRTHPMVFKVIKSLDDAKTCQILFVCPPAQSEASKLLDVVRAAHVLTVTENMPHFGQCGLVVDFVTEQDKIRFEINNAAAAKAGLTISSKLMALAKPLEP
jgi:hypothetical protein